MRRGCTASRATDEATRATRSAGIFKGRTHVELQRHRRRDEEHRNIAPRRPRAAHAPAARRHERRPLRARRGQGAARRPHLHPRRAQRRQRRPAARRQPRAPHQERGGDGARSSPISPRRSTARGSSRNTLDFTLADLGYQFPDYPLPPGETHDSFLRKITWNARDGALPAAHRAARRRRSRKS